MPNADLTLTRDSIPLLEPQGLALFHECLAQSQVYLEYGCGGSTVQAAAAGTRSIFSVDTDLSWLEQGVQVLRGMRSSAVLIHCNLGPVLEWGFPAGTQNIKEFHTYAALPWAAAQSARQVPDLVLVDGRFRVASLLYSLACAQAGTTILFDDYADRPHYHAVEQFCQPTAFAGRMARFEAGPIGDALALMRCFAQYSLEPD
jgi:hypothetical protein